MTGQQASTIAPPLDVSDLQVRTTTPPHVELERQALDWPQRASAVQIIDQASYDQAIELLRAAKALRTAADVHHRPVIDAAYASHKAALAALKRVDEPLAMAETLIKTKVGIWDREQELRRREAERIAREQAERKAAEELEKEIEAIEASGARPEEVAAVIKEAERTVIVSPMAQPTYRPASGVSVRAPWSAVAVNMTLMIEWVAKNPQFSSLLQVNQVALNQLARAQQSNLRIPGVQVRQGTTVVVR